MKNSKRIISAALCLMLSVAFLLLTACGKPERAAESAYTPLEKYELLSTTCVAENSRYSLIVF